MSADRAGKSGKGRGAGGRAGKPTSRQIDAKYVGRARSVFKMIRDLAEIYDDRAELAAMNRGKRGRPYAYTHSLVAAISGIRDALNLDFRGCEGLLPEGRGPEYTTIFRRINAQDASVRESLSDVSCGGGVAIHLVPDGTGLTPATRSEYVRVVHRLKRGFLRLTIMINKETLEIVSFRLTDDTVGESTVFEDLLHDALANLGVDPDRRRAEVLAQRNSPDKTYRGITLTADGGYDAREIFSACRKLGITTRIRVRKDANALADGVDRARSEAVLDQLGGPGATPAGLAALKESEREANRKKWKERVRYGTRWLVEIVISAFKRTYGDAVAARKMGNIRQEIRLKIRTYNRMLRIGREAAMKA